MKIYVLSDPRSLEPRYVGKTERQVRARMAEHQALARSTTANGQFRYRTHLYCWLRSLSVPPLVEVVENCLSREELNEAERFYIAYFRSLGFPLVNHSDGGEGQTGFRFTPEQKVRLSEIQRGLKKPGVSRAQRGGHKNRGRVQSAAERAKKSRPIVDQYGTKYFGINEAARVLRISNRSIAYVLAGEYAQTHGYAFKYETQSLV